MSDKTEKPARDVDPEFVALNKIAKTFAGLDPDARQRVLQYLVARFLPCRMDAVSMPFSSQTNSGTGLGS